MIVFDEHSRPTVRSTLGALMAASTHVDMAVASMRLAGIDVTAEETLGLQRLRVVFGRLDAEALLQTRSRPRDQIGRLESLAASGVLQVRTVPRFRWTPDFSLFRGAALIGAHYSELPYPADGIALTCLVRDSHALRLCARRFEGMWQLGYDVLPVVHQTLRDLLRASP